MLKKIARKFGYSLKRQYKSEEFPDVFSLVLKYNPITTIIDCGANVGRFYRSVRECGFKGRYILIEPNPKCHDLIGHICARDPSAELVKCACGAGAGEAELNIVGVDGDSGSLSSLRDQTRLIRKRFNHAEVTETVKVPVKRLDTLLKELGVGTEEPIFLKTDTQGFDLDVLEGLGEYKSPLVGFHTELSVLPLYHGAPSHWKLLEFARDNGFNPLSFNTTSRNTDGRLIEYDALFVRDDHYPEIDV